jgi:hypothetical protein
MRSTMKAGCLGRAGAAVAAAAMLAAGAFPAIASEDSVAKAPGHMLYGDPAVPDISGLWSGPLMLAPGAKIDQPVGPGFLSMSWAPWPPPLKPAYKKVIDERVAAAKAGRALADNGARCLPFGMLGAAAGGVFPGEIIQTPGAVTFLGFGARHIVWTDGRSHPANLKPSYGGHSVGYWEGDTLHVETVGILQSVRVAGREVEHSDKLKIKWTVQRVTDDVLHVHITLYDEDAFTEPMVITSIRPRKAGPEWQVLDDYSCFENNLNQQDSTGATGFQAF